MTLRKNVIANYLGKGWTALIGIAFLPLYIKYLGMEAYGLIGVFAFLQAWLTLLDMGMTPTLTREMARYTAGAHTAQSIRDLLRSLEVISFAVALLIGIAIWFLATWLSAHWLQVETLPVEEVAHAISIIGIVVALRFIESLYRGAILGLQKQVWLSLVSAGLATLRWGGAVCVLVWVAPSIELFFIWQGFVSALTIAVFVFAVYRYLPPLSQTARFSWVQLINIRRFVGGLMLSILLSLLLLQVDKIILSRMLSLEMFGYYTLAGTVAAALYQLTGPITQAFYPRFAELVAKDSNAELIKTYHQGAQLVSVMIVPAALMLMFFSENILLLWTDNAAVAHNVAPLLTLLSFGTMLNGLMHIPYMLTLACGWSGYAVRVNLVAVAVLVPATIVLTLRYGAIGAAWCWVMLNLGFVFISARFLFRRLLKTEMWCWYRQDIVQPIIGASLTAAFFWLFDPGFTSSTVELLWILVGGLCAVFVSMLVAPSIRSAILRIVVNRIYASRSATLLHVVTKYRIRSVVASLKIDGNTIL